MAQPLITGGQLSNLTAEHCPSGLPLGGHLGTQHSDRQWVVGCLYRLHSPGSWTAFRSPQPTFPLVWPHRAAGFAAKRLTYPPTSRPAPLVRESCSAKRKLRRSQSNLGQRLLLEDLQFVSACVFPWTAGRLGALVRLGAN